MDDILHTQDVLPYYALHEIVPPDYVLPDPTIYDSADEGLSGYALHQIWARTEGPTSPPPPYPERQQVRGPVIPSTEPQVAMHARPTAHQSHSRASPARCLRKMFHAMTASMLSPIFMQPASECVACGEVFQAYCRFRSAFVQRTKESMPVELDCKHKYCHPCFNQLVRVACETEGTFPPRCCGERVKLQYLEKNLMSDVLEKYYEMKWISCIPFNERWYCPYADCGATNDTKGRMWMCGKCLRDVDACQSCRQPSHEGDCNPQHVQEELDIGNTWRCISPVAVRNCYRSDRWLQTRPVSVWARILVSSRTVMQ